MSNANAGIVARKYVFDKRCTFYRIEVIDPKIMKGVGMTKSSRKKRKKKKKEKLKIIIAHEMVKAIWNE